MIISVISINYNNGKEILRTMDSVLNQSYNNIEYIVVDDCSTDDSRTLIESYGKRISQSILSNKNEGIYSTMNKGIKAATGDFLLFLNGGDTFFSENAIASLVDCCDPAVDEIVYGNAHIIESSEKEYTYFSDDELTFNSFFHHGAVIQSATLVKRDLFDKYGKFDTTLRIVSDWKWFINAICKHNVTVKKCQEKISVFYYGGASTNPKNFDRQIKEREQVIKQDFPRFLKDYNEYKFFKDKATNNFRFITLYKVENSHVIRKITTIFFKIISIFI